MTAARPAPSWRSWPCPSRCRAAPDAKYKAPAHRIRPARLRGIWNSARTCRSSGRPASRTGSSSAVRDRGTAGRDRARRLEAVATFAPVEDVGLDLARSHRRARRICALSIISYPETAASRLSSRAYGVCRGRRTHRGPHRPRGSASSGARGGPAGESRSRRPRGLRAVRALPLRRGERRSCRSSTATTCRSCRTATRRACSRTSRGRSSRSQEAAVADTLRSWSGDSRATGRAIR